jgi:hypothetical protein
MVSDVGVKGERGDSGFNGRKGSKGEQGEEARAFKGAPGDFGDEGGIGLPGTYDMPSFYKSACHGFLILQVLMEGLGRMASAVEMG